MRCCPGPWSPTLALGGTLLTAPLWAAGVFNAQGRAFGSFGIALAVLAYVFIVITIAFACIVFSPVWAEWRAAERSSEPRVRDDQAERQAE